MIACFSTASRRFLVPSVITNLVVLDSGHGGQTKDLNGDEVDGFDEGAYWFEFICQ